MSTADVSVENESCQVHAERPAVDRCASCGRTVCLGCAVPVRGRVLCTACAARVVGEPPPVVAARRTTRVPDAVAAALLGLALIGTIPPWDGFGVSLSPWRAIPSPSRLIAAVALVVAFTFAAVLAWRGPRHRTIASTAAYAVPAVAGAAAIAWQILASPDYVSHTPAPYAVVTLAAAAAVAGAAALRRTR